MGSILMLLYNYRYTQQCHTTKKVSQETLEIQFLKLLVCWCLPAANGSLHAQTDPSVARRVLKKAVLLYLREQLDHEVQNAAYIAELIDTFVQEFDIHDDEYSLHPALCECVRLRRVPNRRSGQICELFTNVNDFVDAKDAYTQWTQSSRRFPRATSGTFPHD